MRGVYFQQTSANAPKEPLPASSDYLDPEAMFKRNKEREGAGVPRDDELITKVSWYITRNLAARASVENRVGPREV